MFLGNPMLIGATNNEENAYQLGLICGKEGANVGCNMAFAPVIDINYNFRNPVTNVRSFGDNPQKVSKMSMNYVKGAQDANVCVTIKHFPGDGIDGRDQHLVTTVNPLSYQKWMKTYGEVYKESINFGARGLMVGHISLPKYMDKVKPNNPKLRNIPATLNKDLIEGLLRTELKYNGLTMTDASLMTGFAQEGKQRKDIVPLSIAAGCDMLLFTRLPSEDYQFLMDGYKNGIITEQRLDDAITRILALKASLNLHKKSLNELVPKILDTKMLENHKAISARIADESVTLVRDTQKLLPLSPKKHKKVGVIFNGNSGGMEELLKGIPGIKGFLINATLKLSSLLGKKKYTSIELFVKKLRANGFDAFEYDFGDILTVLNDMNKPLKDWTSKFDLIIYFTKWEQMSNQTSLQVKYKAMGFDAPWFVEEVPTMLINVANPYQGYDFPMIKTVINGYSPKEDVYDSIIEKIMGKSNFKGISPIRLDFEEFDQDKHIK